MNEQKILILGKNGQLASALKAVIPKATYIGRPDLELKDLNTLNNINWNDFDIVINTTAYTNTDGAETIDGRREAWQINAAAVTEICKSAQKYNLTLIHISTDYAFDGTKAPHNENEQVAPLNVYGQSKVAGEFAVKTLEKHYLLRTEWLIGSGKNFIRTMIELGKKGISPKVVSDQTGRLTFATTLAESIIYLLQNNSPFGTYHVSNSGKVSNWAEIAQTAFNLAYTNSKVIPTTTEEYFKDKLEAAKRPLKSEFDLTKLESTGFHPTNWQDELENYIKTLIT